MPQTDLITTLTDLRNYLNFAYTHGHDLDRPIMVQGEDGQIEPAALLETEIEEIGADELIFTPLCVIER